MRHFEKGMSRDTFNFSSRVDFFDFEDINLHPLNLTKFYTNKSIKTFKFQVTESEILAKTFTEEIVQNTLKEINEKLIFCQLNDHSCKHFFNDLSNFFNIMELTNENISSLKERIKNEDIEPVKKINFD